MEIRATISTTGDSAKVKTIIDKLQAIAGVTLENIEAR